MSLRGIFISSEPWKKAHEHWFEAMAERLKDAKVKGYAFEPHYFKYVDDIMKKLHPRLNYFERTIRARELFFALVCKYLEQHPEVVRREVIDFFRELKEKYCLALITTHTLQAMQNILPLAGLEGFFDIIETSLPEEKDDKEAVFGRFLKRHGKPLLYLGGDKEDSFHYCKKKGIFCVFANFEKGKEIQGVESVHSLHELRKSIEKLA